MKLSVKREVEAKYLSMTVVVRYGDEDMPYDAPLRSGDSWSAVIDLDDARIENWPEGQTLLIDNMKVCDSGTYILLDADRNEIACIEECYVPSALLPGDCGDYLTLNIAETGKITNWLKRPNLSDFEDESR